MSSHKNKKGKGNRNNYSDDKHDGNKKMKKSRFNSNREDKQNQQHLFID